MSKSYPQHPGPEPPHEFGADSDDPGDGGDRLLPEYDEEAAKDAAELVECLLDAEVARAEDEISLDTRTDTLRERSARLAVDAQVVEAMRADNNFEGVLFKRYVGKTYGYAKPIIQSFLRTGEIFAKANKIDKKLKRPLLRRYDADVEWSFDDRDELADRIIKEGMEVFRRALQKRKWDPRQGAALSTYFIGSCICIFGKVYKNWWKERVFADGVIRYGIMGENLSDPNDLELAMSLSRTRIPQPEHEAIVQDEVSRVIASITDTQLREHLGWRAVGYPQSEAAARSGLTEKAAEGRLGRYRKQLKDQPPPQAADNPDAPGEVKND